MIVHPKVGAQDCTPEMLSDNDKVTRIKKAQMSMHSHVCNLASPQTGPNWGQTVRKSVENCQNKNSQEGAGFEPKL